MLSDQVTKVSFLEIERERWQGWGRYQKRVDVTVRPGEHETLIMNCAKNGALPTGTVTPVTRRPGNRPERYLDLDSGSDDAVRAYVFFLNAHFAGDNLLQFSASEKPFWFHPISSKWWSEKEVLYVPESHVQGYNRWAFFICNVKKARESELAERISIYSSGHHHAMNIPFCFNLFDPLLEASPYAVSSQPHTFAQRARRFFTRSHRDGHHKSHKHGKHRYLTHGGVHPSAASYLIVDI